MTTTSFDFSERWKKNFERIDNIVCVGIFFAASMPAIVVMLLLSLPLLPFFGFCFCLGASFPSKFDFSTEEASDDTVHRGQSDRPPGGATPRYA